MTTDGTTQSGKLWGGERPLELRLLAGEALYVPRGLGCVLHEVRAPSRLLVLTLRPWA